jgi:glycosyltransferase involved in cell wall biosynthesis
VLFPANFWRHKNHDGLLRALQILRNEGRLSLDAVLTGFPVPNGYPVQAKAAEYGVSSQVHFLGHVDTRSLAQLYRRARMLVFPSYFEGFGIPLVEAMAAGCPIVGADATSIPEICGDAALLVDPDAPRALADAIDKLWSDDTLYREMVVRGQARVKSFTPAIAAQAHLAAFELARQTFSRKQYRWKQWGYRPFNAARAEVLRAGRLLGLRS